MDAIKKKQGWTSTSGSDVSTLDIKKWSISKLKSQLRFVKKENEKSGWLKGKMNSRVRQLEEELGKRRRAQQQPKDIVKEMGKRSSEQIEAAKRKRIEEVTITEDLKKGPIRIETREDIRRAMEGGKIIK